MRGGVPRDNQGETRSHPDCRAIAVLAMHFPPRALKAQRAAGQRLCKSIHSVLVAITEGRVRRVSLLDSEDMTGRPEKR
jgi:hypothetical protein